MPHDFMFNIAADLHSLRHSGALLFYYIFFLKSFGLKARPFGKGGMISLREMEHY